MFESLRKLPFVAGIFWKVFAGAVVLVLAYWFLYTPLTGSPVESQDYVGSAICGVILSYLVHLWLLPDPDSDLGDDERTR